MNKFLLYLIIIFTAILTCFFNAYLSTLKFNLKIIPLVSFLFILEGLLYWWVYKTSNSYFICWLSILLISAITSYIIDYYIFHNIVFSIKFIIGFILILIGCILIKL
jgi:hypothetical protein